ncbi:MAG: transporter substrate-binding domain-containing protein [Oscillospiraceae bacterium]
MFKMKKLAAVAMATVLSLGAVSCGADVTSPDAHSVAAIKKKGSITIATESQYAPFCFKDDKGNIIGLEPSFMQAIADDLGVKLDIQDMAFDSVIPSVQSGACDIGMAGLTPTAKRKESVDMTDFYNHGGQAMLVLTKDLDTYASADTLKGKKIAAQKASLQQTIGEEQFKDSTLSLLPKVPQCVEELKMGNVDAVLVDDVTAKQYADMSGGVISVSDVEVKVDESELGSAAAVMKGNTDLNDYLNGLIKKLWESGDLDKWYISAKDTASKLGLDV